MALDVLQPVPRRRRRRRYRAGRLAAIALLTAGAAAVGVYVGTRHVGSERAPRAARVHSASAAVPAPPPPRVAVRPAQPLQLLSGPPLLRTHVPVTASSAIVVDADTGRVVYALRAHVRRPIASTTKIMTAVVALQRLAPRRLVTVDRSAPRVPLVKEGLRAGERVRAWKLFYGLLLYSGNDDALALAIAAAGSRARFVGLMNDEAKRLGLRDSHFRSPSGVEDADNYSSAWDLAALTRVALGDARFRTIVRTRIRKVPWSAPTFAKIYVNKNLLLGRYRGADGVKTGFTTKAGHCLVASATRDGVSLIAVVLHSRDQYADARRLLDRGFRAVAGRG